MSKETYAQAIRAARERYKEAMDGAAADVVYICRTYNKARAAVCKEIAGDGWNALDVRTRKFEKTAGQTVEEARRRREQENERKAMDRAKSVMKDPDKAAKIIATLPPTALDTVYHEARLTRAGEDRTPAARKAAKAAAHKAVEPMRRAVATTSAALGIEALKEARDDLTEAIAEHALTKRQIEQADTLVNEIANLLMEAKFGQEARA